MMFRLALITPSMDGAISAAGAAPEAVSAPLPLRSLLPAGRNQRASRRSSRPLCVSAVASSAATSALAAARWRVTSSQFRSTAITMSAPSARHSDTGTGLTRPPSTSRRPWCTAGVNTPGSAIEARTAPITGPERSHTSRPLARSVATQPKVLGRCSMPGSAKCLLKNPVSLPPAISPPPSFQSSRPATDDQVRLRAQGSSRSCSPAA